MYFPPMMPPKKRLCLGQYTHSAKRTRVYRQERETPEQRQHRVDEQRIRTSQSRAQETPEQKEQRLEKLRIRAAQYRAQETPQQKERRLENLRIRAAHSRAQETPQQKERRLEVARIRAAKTRAQETPQQKELRLKDLRIRAAQSRAQKMPQQNKQRLEDLRFCVAQSREQEMLEQQLSCFEISRARAAAQQNSMELKMKESESDSDTDQEKHCLPPPLQVDVPDVTIKQENSDDDLLDNPYPEYGDNQEEHSIKQEPMDTMQWEEAEENNTDIVVKEEPLDEEEYNEDYPSSPLGSSYNDDQQEYTRGEINDWTARKCKVEMQDELDDDPLVTQVQQSQQGCQPLSQVRLQLITMDPHQPGFRPLLPKGPPGTLLAAPILSSQGSLLLMRVISAAKEPPPLHAMPKSSVFYGQGSVTVPHSRWTSLIPTSFNTITVEWSADERGFKGLFRAALHCMRDCRQWLQQFEQLSNTNWVLVTSHGESGRFILTRNYVCHLSGWKTKRFSSDRSQGCKAALSFRIKRSSYYNMCQDAHMAKNLAGIIHISFRHSHSLDIKTIGKWLRRRPWLREAFFDYFKQGMTPAVAMRHHEDLVLAAEGVDHLCNRSINPPSGWVYQQYRLWKNAGRESIHQMRKRKDVSATTDVTADTTDVTELEEASNVTRSSAPDGLQETTDEKNDGSPVATHIEEPNTDSCGSYDAAHDTAPSATVNAVLRPACDTKSNTAPAATQHAIGIAMSDDLSEETPKAPLCIMEDTQNSKNDAATKELKTMVKSGTRTTPAQSSEVKQDSSHESVLENTS